MVRYWNSDVMDNIDGVLDDLLRALRETRPSPPTPLPGERGEKHK
jgi:very-short-patch-repair endonuclease